jgi:uncharacterized protein with HEPN domain
MSRDYRLYLEDIQQAARKISVYLEGRTFDHLREEGMRLEAVLFNLQIIGEAAKNIPDEIRDQYPAVEWRKIAGLRDFIAHAYFTINLDIIRDVIENKLPDLRTQIDKMLEEIPPSESD